MDTTEVTEVKQEQMFPQNITHTKKTEKLTDMRTYTEQQLSL